MAGYSYYHVSMRSQISGGQPFAPFVPSQFNRNDPTKKKIVPVTSRPYHDSDDDDDDDGEWNQQRQTSPPRGHPSNSQGDYISNKESIGSTINKPDGFDNGISYGREEGTKPSFVGAIKKGRDHDGYNNGYGGRKQPESSTLRPNNKYDATNYGFDEYKERPKSKPKPYSSPIYNSGYGHDKPFGTPIEGNTELSKPTNDIDEAIGFLKEEAANRGYKEWHKQPKYEADNNPHERLKKVNVPLIKNDRPYSNFSDGKSSNSGVINHIEAEKRFNGMTI